eukprot:3053722-Rhodomonas_salina.1
MKGGVYVQLFRCDVEQYPSVFDNLASDGSSVADVRSPGMTRMTRSIILCLTLMMRGCAQVFRWATPHQQRRPPAQAQHPLVADLRFLLLRVRVVVV